MTAKSRIPGKNIKAAKWYGKGYAGTIGMLMVILLKDMIWQDL